MKKSLYQKIINFIKKYFNAKKQIKYFKNKNICSRKSYVVPSQEEQARILHTLTTSDYEYDETLKQSLQSDATYFEKLKTKVNKGRPAYKQVVRIKLREKEFIKNATMKIVRYLNIPGEAEKAEAAVKAAKEAGDKNKQ